jgi:transcription antitermination factor NusG
MQAKRTAWPLPLDPARAIPEGLTWYVITVTVNREFESAKWLESDAGAFTLVPLETRTRGQRRGGVPKEKRETYQLPLFYRYVLAGFASAPQWLQIRGYKHVRSVLGIAGTPVAVSVIQVKALQIASQAARTTFGEKSILTLGRAKIIASGLFSGHYVEVKEVGKKHAKIEQVVFGEKRLVKIAVEDLEQVA